MDNRTRRIVKQLGMTQGAAAHKLRSRILFNLLQELKRNVCFVCERLIEVVGDLSIEHKEPWEGRSAELFWDLKNIAFSHKKCNKRHSYNLAGRPAGKKIGPKNTAWCSYHETFEPKENFYRDPVRWNGVRAYCKTGRYERYPKNLKSD